MLFNKNMGSLISNEGKQDDGGRTRLTKRQLKTMTLEEVQDLLSKAQGGSTTTTYRKILEDKLQEIDAN